MNSEKRPLHQEIEKDVRRIARALAPHLPGQIVINADSGQRVETKQIIKTVLLNGTTGEYSFSQSFAFTDPDSVMITVCAKTTTVIYGEMLNGHSFRLTAAAGVINLTVKVFMRGM